MPGTIRVSVLEFMDLPNLSTSPIPIKVSMGRRHYEAWDKGDFSFPLTTLRDEVILVIQDAEGNEISRAGVQAKSIVEKGQWDDIFPLERGGRVHLKFQFALSEDDRNRIRMMRETVLKRKHVELQDTNHKSSKSNPASSLYLNPELSDSQNCLLQVGDLSSTDTAHQSPSPSTESFSKNEKLGSENTEVLSPSLLRQISVKDDADRNEDNSPVVHQPKVNNTTIVKNLGRQSPHINEPPRTVRPEVKKVNLFRSEGSDRSNVPAKSEEKTLNFVKAASDGKSPSNVKKVISAFESSLTQDTRPRIKPTIRNTQNSVVEKQASLKEKQLQKATDGNTKLNPSGTASFESEMKHEVAYVKREKEKLNFIETLDGTELSEDPANLKAEKSQTGSEKEKTREEHKEMNAKNDDESRQTSIKKTELEADVIPMSVPKQPDSHRNSAMEERKTQRPLRNSLETKFQGASANKTESVSTIKDEQFSSKRHGGWIFPDEGRWLCATAGGRSSDTSIHREEMKVSMEEDRGASETKANEGKPESSEEEHRFEGPLANVIPSSNGENLDFYHLKPGNLANYKGLKFNLALFGSPRKVRALKIAIMVGFGTLVLLTRQRKKKK